MISTKKIAWLICYTALASNIKAQDFQEYADGYYSFEEGPGLTPPSVRKPPYTQTNAICSALLPHSKGVPKFYHTLCGDLNKGYLPQNPLGQAPFGEVYPLKIIPLFDRAQEKRPIISIRSTTTFLKRIGVYVSSSGVQVGELIKNKTLEYLSEALPLLKDDNTIPKVAKFQGQIIGGAFPRKYKRDVTTDANSSISYGISEKMARNLQQPTGRGICDGSDGIFCRVFSSLFPQRSGQPVSNRNDNMESNDILSLASTTPCPSKAEYATPIFAKNYQGLWRYVVQIPYEGYLTQTVEVTRCLQGQCNFIEGQCLSSPRWISLLVAEIFYPNAYFPTTPIPPKPTTPLPHFDVPVPPVADFQTFQQYLSRRAGSAHFPMAQNTFDKESMADNSETTEYCDGYDQIGCIQIRLFYDWFLVQGACKCWKPPSKNILLQK